MPIKYALGTVIALTAALAVIVGACGLAANPSRYSHYKVYLRHAEMGKLRAAMEGSAA